MSPTGREKGFIFRGEKADEATVNTWMDMVQEALGHIPRGSNKNLAVKDGGTGSLDPAGAQVSLDVFSRAQVNELVGLALATAIPNQTDAVSGDHLAPQLVTENGDWIFDENDDVVTV